MPVNAPEIGVLGVLAPAPPFPAGRLANARRLFGPSTLLVLEVAGVLRGSEQPLRARYVGSGANFRFLADLLFAAFEMRDVRKPAALAARRDLARDGDADVVLSDLPPAWSLLCVPAADILMPAWVGQRVTLDTEGRLLPRSVESEARRHMRRAGLTVDFASCSAQMQRFYHQFYQPFVRARFGPQAVVVDEAAFLEHARGKTLGRVFAQGEWTAGMLLEQRGKAMRFGWFGARTVPAHRGASEVLDVACIRRAARSGMRYVAMGNSRPSLSDGVLRYKARFGADIHGTRFPQDRLGISIRRATPALVERLNQERLVAIGRGRALVHHLELEGNRVRVTLTRLENA